MKEIILMVLQKIQKTIIDLCQKHEWDWEWHIRYVVKKAKCLAKKLKADEQIIETAAWLHNIAKLKGYPRHHVKGAEIASKILKETNFPPKKI